jgi:hypothetical protein
MDEEDLFEDVYELVPEEDHKYVILREMGIKDIDELDKSYRVS